MKKFLFSAAAVFASVVGYICFLSVLQSCDTSSKKEKSEIFVEHDTEIELFSSTGELACSDNYLAVSGSEIPVELYSLPDMKKHTTYGSIGQGPEEFLLPMLAFAEDREIGVNDLKSQSLTLLSIREDKDSLSLSNRQRLVSDEGRSNSVRSFIRIGKDHYAGIIAQKSGEFFALADSNLHTVGYFGESPVDDPSLSIFASRMRLGNCRTASFGDSFVYSTRDLPFLAKYHLENGSMVRDWSLYFDKTYYEVRDGDLLFSKESTFGQVMSVQMDHEYIYVLYLDQLMSEYDYGNSEKSQANKILVFNYQGEQVSTLKLDCRIGRMALCRKRNLLFGIANLPEPTLVRFNLPKDMK